MLDAAFKFIIEKSVRSIPAVVFLMILRWILQNHRKKYSVTLWDALAVILLAPMIRVRIFNTGYFEKAMTGGLLESVRLSQTALTHLSNPVISLKYLWIFVTGMICLYDLLYLFKIHKEVKGSVMVDDNVYICENSCLSFVKGIISPKIYVAGIIDAKDEEYIVVHEKQHIRSFDHIRALALALIRSLYWFNPLLLTAMSLYRKDIEMACDEGVIDQIGERNKGEYLKAIIRSASEQNIWIFSSFNSGYREVKMRISNLKRKKQDSAVMKYLLLVAVISVIAVSIVQISKVSYTNVKAETQQKTKETEEAAENDQITAEEDFYIYPLSDPKLTAGYGDFKNHYGEDFVDESGDNGEVLATQNGVVVEADYNLTQGYYIILKHGDDIYSLYANLGNLNVTKGDSVKQGDTIAYLGMSGNSTAPHVHFAIRKIDDEENLLNHFYSVYENDEIYVITKMDKTAAGN